jgi:hypothetical protein
VVRFAGGLLFDRVMAGWDVTVHIGHHGDSRPLHILGTRVVDLECLLATQGQQPLPEALAVEAELYRRDARVRQMVEQAMAGGTTEVQLWCDSWPSDVDGGVGSVCHRLSRAARAFKGQALVAAALPVEEVEPTESFRSGPGALAWDVRDALALA